jgi:hypothetical protein
VSYYPAPTPQRPDDLSAYLYEELRKIKNEFQSMESTDYGLEVARGNIESVSSVRKFGRNEAIGTTREDVIDAGGTITYLTSAETMDITGGAADVLTTGTGAWTVQIYGVDGDYAQVNETVDMAGAGGVTTSNSYLRVYRMIVRTAGTGGANSANIVATASTAGTVQAQITTGYNQTLMAAYTVAAGTTAYLHHYYHSINKKNAATIDVEIYVRPFGETFQLKHVLSIDTTGTSSHQHRFWVPLKITEKSDIILRAVSDAADTDVSAGFDLVEDS